MQGSTASFRHSTERRGGKGIGCDVAKSPPLPDLDFHPALESAEHQGRPRKTRGPRSDTAVTEIRAGCDDSRVTTTASCLPTIVALVPRDHSPTRKPVPELNERLRASYPMLRRALVSPEAPQVPSHWDSLSFAPSQEWCHLLRFLSLSFCVSFSSPSVLCKPTCPGQKDLGKSQASRMKTIVPCSVATCYPQLPR